MSQEINPWAMYPHKTSTASLPEALKMEVTTRANELIETVLKPKYIQPPPENPPYKLFLLLTPLFGLLIGVRGFIKQVPAYLVAHIPRIKIVDPLLHVLGRNECGIVNH